MEFGFKYCQTELGSVSLFVKASALKQQISKFCLQILSTKASFHIYDSPLTGMNVIAGVCALNSRMQF